MGLLSWLDKRATTGNIKVARKSIHGLAIVVDRDPQFAAAIAEHLSKELNDMWAREGRGASDYVQHLRCKLAILRPSELFDGGFAVLKQADQVRSISPPRAEAMALVAHWLVMMSVAGDAAAEIAGQASDLVDLYSQAFAELIATAGTATTASTASLQQDRAVSGQRARIEHLSERRLASFSARLREHDIQMNGTDAGQICGLVAALFALLVNEGNPLSPLPRASDRDCAIAWLGFIAADTATQLTGRTFEPSAATMMHSLLAPGARHRSADVLDEIKRIHQRVSASMPWQFLAKLAFTFSDWAIKQEKRGVPVLARNLNDVVVIVARARC